MASETQTRTGTPLAASAISGHFDTRTAAMEVADKLHDSIPTPCDLVIMFASFHHAAALRDAAETIRNTLSPGTLLGVTAESVLGESEEIEGRAGLSAIALRLPGVELTPWQYMNDGSLPLDQPQGICERIGASENLRATIMLSDPFTTPMPQLLDAISDCCPTGRSIPVLGGLASGASMPGHNVLIYNDEVLRQGTIGVSIAGNIEIDALVSQGCRPIAKPLVITKVKDNVILELGNRPAMEILRDLANDISEYERELLSKGLLMGVVIDERKPHFGRGDFLMRNVIGFDQKKGGIVVAETPKVGRTIQFHVRDAETAHEDFQLLLDLQEVRGEPFAAMLFTCNGRGERLFEEPSHDTSLLRERLGEIPIAGFFAAGEIGPVGDHSFIHGHTASVALFRSIGNS